ncbi:MAG: arginine--tRNA ligase [Candidatus Bathyarchaeota archaeon]|nr:arginine--tRNA ligase [Candidatus Bathyarchaeum tardum]
MDPPLKEEKVMVPVNPFAEFYNACETLLKDTLQQLYPDVNFNEIIGSSNRSTLQVPPNLEFGELATSICFELAKQAKKSPRNIAQEIVDAINVSKIELIDSVSAAGAGYVNFRVNSEAFSCLTLKSINELDLDYGFIKTREPKKILLEHTSVNPVHPIHIGQARNPVLGDAISRILKKRGHDVSCHYYVDDVGRQSAVIAYGYTKLGKPKPDQKPDRFIGGIYTVTSCIMEVNRYKKAVETAKTSCPKDLPKLNRQLDEWISISAEIQERFPELFGKLLDEINKDADPELQIGKLIQNYEAGKEPEKQLLREVCELCLSGFKETLASVEISIDSWDWESDLIWRGDVKQVIADLEKTSYVFWENGVLEFDAEKVADDLDLKPKLGISADHEITPLTLARADGTSLYTTRDIAYHLWKFTQAERVVNVIGMEQTLPQLQLKLALSALGHPDYIPKLTHFAYSLVRLPGYRMSSRRGRYITLDEVMDGAAERAYFEVSKRSPMLSEDEKRKISEFVGKGAVKYALIAVDPSKPVVFTWDRVLDFEKNSAPYIQYSHARGCSILRKASLQIENADYSLLNDLLEKDIMLTLARFPEVFVDCAESLKPNAIAEYVNSLADKFNKFYTKLPVIKAESEQLGAARLALVDAVRIVLRNCLILLGIESPEKM